MRLCGGRSLSRFEALLSKPFDPTPAASSVSLPRGNRATTVALTQREFDVATPDGKLVIAKKLQEDMVRAALVAVFWIPVISSQGMPQVAMPQVYDP